MPKRRDKREETCALIFEDYAVSQAMHNRKLQGYYNQRENKRQEKFGFSNKKQKFNRVDEDNGAYEDLADLALFNAAAGHSDFSSQLSAGSSSTNIHSQDIRHSTVIPDNILPEDPQ